MIESGAAHCNLAEKDSASYLFVKNDKKCQVHIWKSQGNYIFLSVKSLQCTAELSYLAMYFFYWLEIFSNMFQ